MKRSLFTVSVAAFSLMTCSGCQIEDIDMDANGSITIEELAFAAENWLCGDQEEPSEVPSEPEPTDPTEPVSE
jgi:hypothetical protein